MKLEFSGSHVTAEVGSVAYRELGEMVDLTEVGGDALTDRRLVWNKQLVLGTVTGWPDGWTSTVVLFR